MNHNSNLNIKHIVSESICSAVEAVNIADHVCDLLRGNAIPICVTEPACVQELLKTARQEAMARATSLGDSLSYVLAHQSDRLAGEALELSQALKELSKRCAHIFRSAAASARRAGANIDFDDLWQSQQDMQKCMRRVLELAA